MSKLACPCGYVFDLSPIPHNGWLTVRDSDQDELTPDESTPPNDRIERWHELYHRSGNLHECPRCGRILWRKPREQAFTIYQKDSG